MVRPGSLQLVTIIPSFFRPNNTKLQQALPSKFASKTNSCSQPFGLSATTSSRCPFLQRCCLLMISCFVTKQTVSHASKFTTTTYFPASALSYTLRLKFRWILMNKHILITKMVNWPRKKDTLRWNVWRCVDADGGLEAFIHFWESLPRDHYRITHHHCKY